MTLIGYDVRDRQATAKILPLLENAIALEPCSPDSISYNL